MESGLLLPPDAMARLEMLGKCIDQGQESVEYSRPKELDLPS
ncbi:MAG: hypothetical protein R3C28_04660 [Pirellulaceae bacterium]